MAGIRGALILFCLLLLWLVSAEPEYLRSFPLASVHLHALVTAVLLIGCARQFQAHVVRKTLKPAVKSGLTIAFMVLCLLLVLEIGFTYVARTHSVNVTLASKAWSARHWHTNELGYRDASPFQKDTTRRRLFFLGDSFTAGHGIEDPDDRFANIAGAALSDRFSFFDIGRRGADTRLAYENLKRFPLRPDVVVLQYFGNDVEGLAVEALGALPLTDPVEDLPALLQPVVRSSYLVNYLFWGLARPASGDYLRVLETCFADTALRARHFADIERIETYCRSSDARLLVVVFPMLDNVDASAFYMDPLINWLEQRGVPVIDVRPLVAALPVERRIIHAQDPHPSAEVHRRVAEAIVREVSTRAGAWDGR